jgi:hypothetical protein
MAVPLAIIVGVIAWVAHDWRLAVALFCATYGIGITVAMVILLRTRKLSLVDLWLPVPVAILWSALLSIVSVGAEVFTAPACIGSAFVFSLSLSTARKFNQSSAWTIAPALVFIYEMLPINLPGPVDDYLSFGGAATLFAIQILLKSSVRYDTVQPRLEDTHERDQAIIGD